tara:strand:- start:274 stop:435 length:162 start_codon:yes stop_codon:yes gene_type:complete
MDSLKYFELLDNWTNRLHKVTEGTKRSRLFEYWKVLDEARFTTIEISLIMSNK